MKRGIRARLGGWHGQAQRGHVDAVVRAADDMPAPAWGGLGHATHACILLAAILLLALSLAGTAQGQSADGSIVGWGWQVVVSQGALDNLVAVAAGYWHSLGLKSDGSIVAWGWNDYGHCDVPAPNADFVAVAGGWYHSLGLKSDGSIVAWGWNDSGQCNVPAPNADFVAVAGGYEHSLGLKGIFGDFDVDGDVDLSDFDVLIGCLSGPGVRAPLGCARASLDGDVDVDLADFAFFQAHFGEPG